jgi:hypothetical protein
MNHRRKIIDMSIKVKVAGLQFETTLNLFFLNNPSLDRDKGLLAEELGRMGDAVLYNYSKVYDVACFLTLVDIIEE